LYHRLDRVGIEAVAYQSSAVQELIRTTDDLPILGIAADTDKLSRARLWEVRAQQGLVYADRSSAWWGNFIDEALDFPRGSHDDQIDAVSVGWHAAARPNSFSEIW
jgi:predicted phage terminase large subunit-like protein